MGQREQVKIRQLERLINDGGETDVSVLAGQVATLESQVATLQAQVAELQGFHGPEFSSAFSTAFWRGAQQ